MDQLIAREEPVDFTPSRASGEKRLAAFKGRMGRHYAGERNHDLGPSDRSNVSALSPWVRSRQLLEEELVRAALDRFALSTAEKFVQEVCWRTYFKGWLEHRPTVWDDYRRGLNYRFDAVASNSGLAKAYEEAIEGRTGIEGFDDWARELVETGYLHNHARMWFASIWIFTLRLPWELGADFFLKHLMDGDAASNTCSWRWVAGLHTPGKTYLARRSNIAKYTGGRFSPAGLASEAPAIDGANPSPGMLIGGEPIPEGDIALLLTEEDLHVETLCPPGAKVKALAGVTFPDARSTGGAGDVAKAFVEGAMDDSLARGSERFGLDARKSASEDLLEWARSVECKTIVTGFPPVGWVRPHLDALRASLAEEGIRLLYAQRDWDRAFWPHARKGFFGLKKQIPSVLAGLGFAV
ncbi:MAG: FAD-binding domain-containing protein [Pseudomonadota bacterium]